MQPMGRFWKEETGAETVEYGLILSLVVLAVVTAVGLVGGSIANWWNDLAGQLGSISL